MVEWVPVVASKAAICEGSAAPVYTPSPTETVDPETVDPPAADATKLVAPRQSATPATTNAARATAPDARRSSIPDISWPNVPQKLESKASDAPRVGVAALRTP